MKKIRIETIGCKVNFAESERMKEIFIAQGYLIAKDDDEPDLILINTCTVTGKAERDARKIIRRLKREHPTAVVIAAGCMSEFNPTKTAEILEVDAVLGQSEKYKAPFIIDEIIKGNLPRVLINTELEPEFEFAASYDPENRTRGFLKLQDGCDYYCTYCAVAYSRGQSRSMDFDEIIPSLNKIRSAGFREIVISGINLGTYFDKGKNFSDVIELIAGSDLDIRVRISSIEPNLLTDEILELTAKSDKICPHFHIPLQSGSDTILKEMHRRYTTDFFRKLILKIKSRIPDCCLGIDVITGFPGETDELFGETYEFLNSLPISYLHVFSYSERKGTPAAEMAGKVSEFDKKQRTRKLLQLSDKKKEEFYQSQLGNEFFVIPEYKPPSKTAFGWTENYIRTKFFINDYSVDIIKLRADSIDNDGVVKAFVF
jgi:threonylcarbamoyladenosine tRNA methylthiotransferase MtaB